MPRNAKEGILFSFTMSALMIYLMAALNYGVRTGDLGAAAWTHALLSFPLGYVVGMICDLFICTPTSRKATEAFCTPSDRPVWRGICTKFCMVVLMTVFMTVFGAVMAVGFSPEIFAVSCQLFPYNFTIALPIQMLIIAPISGKFVNWVGDKLGWNGEAQEVEAVAAEA